MLLSIAHTPGMIERVGDGSDVAGSDLGRWDSLPLPAIVELMASFDARWWFTGGHALELHLGRSWRGHDDVDIGICRRAARHLSGLPDEWEILVAAQGVLTPWDRRELCADRHENNLWLRRHGGPWRLDVTVGEGDVDAWEYRRDASLRLPWERVVLSSANGLPYLAPALQLLFKSTNVRPKDQIDAEIVIPELDAWSLALLDVRLPRDHPWATLVAARRHGVTGCDVVELVDVLDAAEVAVWVDGGWGVDALVGEQTRAHADLDLAIPTRQFERARAALEFESFVLVRDDGPYNVVVGDPAGQLVDLHAFDDTTTVVGADGVERHGPDGLAYEAGGFTGAGYIERRSVRCMSAAFQMRSHTGYPVDHDDWHDVSHLHRRFDLPIPADYDEWLDATSEP